MSEISFRPVRGERTIAKVERSNTCFLIRWTITNFSQKTEQIQSDFYQLDKLRVHFILYWTDEIEKTFMQISFYTDSPDFCGNVRVAFSTETTYDDLIVLKENQTQFIMNMPISYEDVLSHVKAPDTLSLRISIPLAAAQREWQMGDVRVPRPRRLSSDYVGPKKDIAWDLDSKPKNEVIAPPSKVCKESTGYVGLLNQGATCYMNSMLQSLFHLPAFRRLVFDLPTTGMEDVETSIPLNLQRLFCRLQISSTACSTKPLTKSLGWNSHDTFIQHDVQEFERVLMDNLERKLLRTVLESSISNLFRGTYISYIRCLNVAYETSRSENFYDLSVLVKGCATLMDSFERYVEHEELCGDNQYQTDEFGKQDAIMGVEFTLLPSVLHIHLRRFEFDYTTMRMVKINDVFGFPKQMDLGKFVRDARKSYVYDLFGVLVHSGGVYGGHYYAFLRTSADPQWYKFNDSVVTRETEETAMDDNFGGKAYSAYMLIYVRHEDVPQLFDPVPDESIPQHLKDFVLEAEKEEQRKRDEMIKESQTVSVRIGLEDDLRENTKHGASGFKTDKERVISIDRGTTLQQVYQMISDEIKRPVGEIRVWQAQYNGIPFKIMKPLDTATIGKADIGFVFVQPKKPDEELIIEAPEYLVFVKFFYQKEECIACLGGFKVNASDPVSSLVAPVNRHLGLPEDTELWIYQECQNAVNKRIDVAETFKTHTIRTGAILILQLPPGESFPEGIEVPEDAKLDTVKDEGDAEGIKPITYKEVFPDHRLLTVDAYLAAVSNTCDVDIFNLDAPTEEPLAVLRVSSCLSWTDMKLMVAKLLAIEYNPEEDAIVIYKCTEASKLPTMKIDTNLYSTLRVALQANPPKGLVRRRFYIQILHGTSEASVVSLSQFFVQFSRDAVTVETQKKILANKTATCMELFEKLDVECDKTNLRFLQCYDKKVTSIKQPDQEFGNSFYTLRVEIMPEDQRDESSFHFLLPVSYGYMDGYMTVHTKGYPFLLPVLKDEEFKDTKERIFNMIKLEERETTVFRFRIDGKMSLSDEVIADSAVLSEVGNSSSLLFILLKDDAKPSSLSSGYSANVPVRIYN